MGRIRILEESLASQIAAGEVVERPASVVKELIENAVDAGARRVLVEATGGGLTRLTVSDDGCGMAPDDATLCFSRHATSKLDRIDDLRALPTFGFRGEALAAIASVARVRLVTRPYGAEAGFEVEVEGGRVTRVGEVGAPYGTRVDVRDLFFNVPARRKFLKTEKTESAHVERTVIDAALFEPAVAFHVDVEGRRSHELPAAPETAGPADRRVVDRVARCLGERVRDELYSVELETGLLRLCGHLCSPAETRRDAAGIHLAVNGRPVTDRGLQTAVKLAFRPALEPGRFPVLALDLEIDPGLVDVNVHPRKAEVRFEDHRRVSAHTIRLLTELLLDPPWRRAGTGSARTYRLGGAGLAGASADELPLGTGPLPTDTTDETAASSGPAPDPHDLGEAHRTRVRRALERFQARVALRAPLPSTRLRSTEVGSVDGEVHTLLGDRFLLVDEGASVLLVDVEAATRAALRAELTDAAAVGAVDVQPMLFPLRFDLTPSQAESLEAAAADLLKLGLEVELFGEGVGLVRGVPRGVDPGRAEDVAGAALEAWRAAPEARRTVAVLDAVCEFAAVRDRGPLLRRLSLLPPGVRRGVLRRLGPDDLVELLAGGSSS